MMHAVLKSVALLLLVSCHRPVDSVSPTIASEIQPEAADTRPDGALVTRDIRVVIEDFKFEPSHLTISPGTKITWVNKDDEPHSATSSEKPKRFDSGVLDSEQTFSFTFTERGTFSYFCKLHPHMTGVIEVR